MLYRLSKPKMPGLSPHWVGDMIIGHPGRDRTPEEDKERAEFYEKSKPLWDKYYEDNSEFDRWERHKPVWAKVGIAAASSLWSVALVWLGAWLSAVYAIG